MGRLTSVVLLIVQAAVTPTNDLPEPQGSTINPDRARPLLPKTLFKHFAWRATVARQSASPSACMLRILCCGCACESYGCAHLVVADGPS